MAEALFWSIVIIGVAAMWGWVFGDDEDERWINARVTAACAFAALLCFWLVVFGFKVAMTQ